MPSPARNRHRFTVRRSLHLFREFRHEQRDPERFYTALADDSVKQVSWHVDLQGRVVLDVGGGPGFFRRAFEDAGAHYVALDADVDEVQATGKATPGTVIGSGMNLPFADDSVDICFSSNVLEHVEHPWRMAEEMLRVTRPSGTVYLSWTVWYGPWGGHETAPWHYAGGGWARRRYVRKNGHEPKNRFGESLFPVTVAAGLNWARSQRAGEIVAIYPRYNPWWTHWLIRVPMVREVVTWNLVIVLRKM